MSDRAQTASSPRQMFEGGKDKKTVMEGMINIHRPKEYWEEKAKESKDAAEKRQPESELRSSGAAPAAIPSASATSSPHAFTS